MWVKYGRGPRSLSATNLISFGWQLTLPAHIPHVNSGELLADYAQDDQLNCQKFRQFVSCVNELQIFTSVRKCMPSVCLSSSANSFSIIFPIPKLMGSLFKKTSSLGMSDKLSKCPSKMPQRISDVISRISIYIYIWRFPKIGVFPNHPF